MMDVGASFGKFNSNTGLSPDIRQKISQTKPQGEFSGWMQKHKQLNPSLPTTRIPDSPYGMTQAPGLQPSMPTAPQMQNPGNSTFGINQGGIGRSMGMPNQMMSNMNPRLMQILQLIGANNPWSFLGR